VRTGGFALLAALVALAAATACKKSEAELPAAKAPARPSPHWLEGRLPASATQGAPVPGGTLRIRIPSEPSNLNRLHDAGSDGWAVRTMLGNVVETLLEVDRSTAPAYGLKPLLAERWEVSPDGRTATFHLRKGVSFHDGASFDAGDVRAVLQTVLDLKNPTATLRSHLADLEGFDTPDPYTVVLRWKQPSHLGIRTFATSFPIFPRAALEGELDALAINRAPVGTGPFRFAGWESGRALELVRNPGYWGRKPHLERVVFRVVKDHTVAMQLLQRGELELLTAVQPTAWRELEKPAPQHLWAQRGLHRVRTVETGYEFIAWNQKRPPFADAKVRRALGHLIPWDALEKGLYLGLQPLTSCPYFLDGPSCDPAIAPLRYDPERARALLAEAGWTDTDGDGLLDRDGVPFRFTFQVFAHSVNSGKLAALVQEAFGKAGVQVEIERVEWAVYIQRLRRHDFDVATLAWAAADTEQDLYQVFHSSQMGGGSNYVAHSDPELDGLLEQSRRTLDAQARVALNRRIHRAVFEDQVYAFLGARTSLELVRVAVKGLRPAVTWYDLREVWLEPQEP
jgi:peptide/nickel transport system substrate-binding protein